MLLRQRLTTFGIASTAAATIALALWLKPWASGKLTAPPPEPPTAVEAGHRIDVVFAVDTTGSMGGLIDAAKRTVWSIATHIREVDPQADLHVGLVAYRDVGDAYVTRDFPLSGNLDAVYQELSSYRAEGGGDVPEDVDAALYDAVHKMSWRSGAKKMIFLVGDAPPASRGDVPVYSDVARDAAAAQIAINTIRCGADGETGNTFQQIAALGNGEFSTIQQDGGVQQIATPYDDQLARLSADVDATTVYYGDDDARDAYEGNVAAAEAAPAAAKADRAAFYAKGAAHGAGGRAAADIVGKVATGAVAVEELDQDKLPGNLRGKSKAELQADLAARAARRQAAQKEIGELTKKREAYLRDHAKDGDGFDTKVKATVERELKR